MAAATGGEITDGPLPGIMRAASKTKATPAAGASRRRIPLMPGSQHDQAATFPRLLLRHAAEHGDDPATREKDLGIWQTWTWRQVAAEVRALGGGLGG